MTLDPGERSIRELDGDGATYIQALARNGGTIRLPANGARL
jgi:hypothetical protein